MLSLLVVQFDQKHNEEKSQKNPKLNSCKKNLRKEKWSRNLFATDNFQLTFSIEEEKQRPQINIRV